VGEVSEDVCPGGLELAALHVLFVASLCLRLTTANLLIRRIADPRVAQEQA
jgi:hypothetical protein